MFGFVRDCRLGFMRFQWWDCCIDIIIIQNFLRSFFLCEIITLLKFGQIKCHACLLFPISLVKRCWEFFYSFFPYLVFSFFLGYILVFVCKCVN